MTQKSSTTEINQKQKQQIVATATTASTSSSSIVSLPNISTASPADSSLRSSLVSASVGSLISSSFQKHLNQQPSSSKQMSPPATQPTQHQTPPKDPQALSSCIQELRSKLPKSVKIHTEGRIIDRRSHDLTYHEPHKPDAVVVVNSEQEVSIVLATCNK
jgi:hypothetical protein